MYLLPDRLAGMGGTGALETCGSESRGRYGLVAAKPNTGSNSHCILYDIHFSTV